jgi:PhoH-like ATPase
MPLPTAPTKKGSLLISAKGQKSPNSPQTTQAHHAPPLHKTEPKKPARQPVAAPITMDKKPVMSARAINTTAPSVSKQNKPAHRSSRRKTIANATRKLFVLDTNVMLHDPSCFFRFEEHDVYLPLITLEELDNHKKGTTETARHGRQVSRLLDELMNSSPNGMDDGLPLTNRENQQQLGKLFFQTQLIDDDLPKSLPSSKADNQILGIVHALQQMDQGRTVVLVSKDINMRIKARALGLNAEDYFNDQVIEDRDFLYTGQLALPTDFWETHSKKLESWQEGSHTYYQISGPLVGQMMLNQFVYLEHPDITPFSAQVVEVNDKTATLRTLIDYSNPKYGIWGIGARNREQNFALNILMDTNIDFVTLLGQAGTGKTLVTIAAALQQTLEMGRFSEVIITRITVPVGEDIGFLPGTEEEKMTPWMGALQDNLEILIKGDANAGEWARAATNELIKNKVKIKAMSFMRGRTFVNKLLILDEAQNLTPKQMKTLITRAGPGTKVVCLGNLAQIDTPYLTEGSSGLAYVVEHFKNWPHSAHITLMRGERSRLADHANEVL